MPLTHEAPRCFHCSTLLAGDEVELGICKECLPERPTTLKEHACGVCGMSTLNTGVCSACGALDLMARARLAWPWPPRAGPDGLNPADVALAGALKMLRVRS